MPQRLQIKVLPAWYQTTLFLVLAPLTLALAIFSFLRIRLLAQQQRERELTTLVEHRTHDIFVLGDVGKEIAATFELDQIARKIYDHLQAIVPTDTFATATQLDRDIVNPDQIRTVIRAFRDNLPAIFPGREEVPKTLVFKLCEYRNSVDYVIPQRVIDRPPSAELAPDQVDQDSLPPYDILDAILKRYVEEDASVADMVAEGFEEAVVRKVIRLVDLNEYKRRQAAVGPRITARNFGKDRRYPITSGFGKQNW